MNTCREQQEDEILESSELPNHVPNVNFELMSSNVIVKEAGIAFNFFKL